MSKKAKHTVADIKALRAHLVAAYRAQRQLANLLAATYWWITDPPDSKKNPRFELDWSLESMFEFERCGTNALCAAGKVAGLDELALARFMNDTTTPLP